MIQDTTHNRSLRAAEPDPPEPPEPGEPQPNTPRPTPTPPNTPDPGLVPGRPIPEEVLHDGGSRDRQFTREVAGAGRRACQALKDHYPQRMAKQRECAQHLAQRGRMGVALGHRQVSAKTDTFGKRGTA